MGGKKNTATGWKREMRRSVSGKSKENMSQTSGGRV